VLNTEDEFSKVTTFLSLVYDEINRSVHVLIYRKNVKLCCQSHNKFIIRYHETRLWRLGG